MNKVEVFIFSYNRGKFLMNCYESACRHFSNAEITVIDDCSTDKETQEILKHISQSARVIIRPETKGRYGGYWKNLQLVIDEIASVEWAIFIEDDMQFIRPFTIEDHKRIGHFFDKNQDVGYLNMEFFKEEHREKDEKHIEIETSTPVYYFDERAVSYRGTVHCNNIGAINIKRMRELKYKIGHEEQEHRDNAKSTFKRMGYYPYPIMMFLPFAPTIKSKKKTIVRRCVETYYKVGFYPYRDMKEVELKEFLSRDIKNLPYISDVLTTVNEPPSKEFVYKDSMKRARGVKRIERMELKIRALLGKVKFNKRS